ncbi:MAG: hypothetical protein OHK0053_14690 [Microscillaceae bacterium]
MSGIPFKPGINFNQGDVLLNIDAQEFRLTLEGQRASFLNVLTGMLADMKSDYPESFPLWQAYVQNYRFGQLLHNLPETKTAEERFFLTSKQVYTLFFQIKTSEERLRKYQILAPFAGTITEANVDMGGMVSPGQALGTIAHRLAYELEAGIPLLLARSMRIGDRYVFRSNELEGSWNGTVVRINNLIDSGTQNIPVYFRLEGTGLREGLYLECEVEGQELEDVVVIPQRLLGRDETVLVLQKDLITKKPVQQIDFRQDSVVVQGLSSKDALILNQFDVPMAGKKVKM